MATPEEQEREFQLREAELKAKERELRLRELETEIYQDQKAQEVDLDSTEPPLYRTSKHNPTENSLQKFTKKAIKFAKFAGCVIVGIAIIRVGFLVGMWLTYMIMAGIIAAVGYQIFLKEND